MNNNSSLPLNIEALKKQKEKWSRELEKESDGTVGQKINIYIRYIEKEIKSVRVSDTKTRWGSCSHDGRLCFSWRLAFAPYEAIDYVVAHEVAHLRHLDHSKEFWTLCEELSIDYAAGKRWMKENGSELMRYVFAQ